METDDLAVNDPAALAWFARLARAVRERKARAERITYPGTDLDALIASAPPLSPADADYLRRLLVPPEWRR